MPQQMLDDGMGWFLGDQGLVTGPASRPLASPSGLSRDHPVRRPFFGGGDRTAAGFRPLARARAGLAPAAPRPSTIRGGGGRGCPGGVRDPDPLRTRYMGGLSHHGG